MKKIIMSVFAIGIAMTLSGCEQAVVYEVSKIGDDSLKESYASQFVKDHPEAIPLINNYNDCNKGKESAVEGCFDHVTHTKEEKDILAKFLNGQNDYLITKTYKP